MAERKLKVAKDGDKWAVVDDNSGELVDTGFKTKAEATAAIKRFKTGVALDPHLSTDPNDPDDDETHEGDEDDDPLADAEEDEREEELDEMGEATDAQSEWNPHGLSAHERIDSILKALQKRGIHIAENVHPTQNAQTAPQNYARRPPDGINAALPHDSEQIEETEELEDDEVDREEAEAEGVEGETAARPAK